MSGSKGKNDLQDESQVIHKPKLCGLQILSRRYKMLSTFCLTQALDFNYFINYVNIFSLLCFIDLATNGKTNSKSSLYELVISKAKVSVCVSVSVV